jgi:Methyltransferase domain
MVNSPATADHAPVRLPASQIDTIRSLVRPAMFWRPAHLAQSAWLEHLPFAFWLVEALRPRSIVELGTHHGVSYFAFCQAVDRLELDTRCFAIDTWKGDEHAGFYGENVFAAVRKRNDEQYSAFSRLVRSSFDDAAPHFAPASIDLLHIDGLHTLESVRADFTTWLPKLSDDAIVLLHDTNVREHAFGVSAFFESIRDDYPCFEFVHGHGLGVVCVGKETRPALKTLLAADKDPGLRHAVRDLFGRLGRGAADSFLLREADARSDRLQARLAAGDTELAAARADGEGRAQALQATVEALTGELAAARAETARLEGMVADYARTLDARFFELATLTENLERAREAAPQAAPQAAGEKRYDELLSYARKLERDHLAVLQSTTWRALEPVRRLLRRLRGQKPPAAFRPRL